MDTQVPSEKRPFRNSIGKLFTRGLFYEEASQEDTTSIIYTLKDRDHKGYPSLYRLYIEIADPTEYRFAVSCLDGWDHWVELSSAGWFQPYVSRWRDELDIKLRSEALSAVISVSKNSGHNAHFQANRYLLEGGWKPEDKKRGRPSKAEIKQELLRRATSLQELEEDASRLRN